MNLQEDVLDGAQDDCKIMQLGSITSEKKENTELHTLNLLGISCTGIVRVDLFCCRILV